MHKLISVDYYMDAQPVEPQSNGYMIAIVICIVIGLIYYFVQPYFQTILDFIETLRSFGEIMSSLSTPTPEPTLENNEKQKKQKEKEKEEKKIKPPKPPVTTPKPDDSSSSIQGSAGYCYVGEWKGIRSCVKVDKSTPCNSQLYTTEELCVNPTLRP